MAQIIKMAIRNDDKEMLDLIIDDDSSLMSEQFDTVKRIVEHKDKVHQMKIKYTSSLLEFIYHYLNGILTPGFDDSSHKSQSENSKVKDFEQLVDFPKPKGVPYGFDIFNKIIGDIFALFDELNSQKRALEDSVNQLSEDKFNLTKQNEQLEKLNQDLQRKLTLKDTLPDKNLLAEINQGNEQLGIKQPFDLISEADKDYFVKLMQNQMDTPMKENSGLDFANLKHLISTNPLINPEDGQSIISKFDNVNRLNDISGDNSNHSLNTFGKNSGPLAALAGEKRQFKVDEDESSKKKDVEELLNQMTDKFTRIEQLMTPQNEPGVLTDSRKDLQLLSKPMTPEQVKEIQQILHQLKQFPSKLMALVGLNRRQDQDLSRVIENFEKTVHDLNADPSKNAQIIHLLEQINVKLGGTNYLTSNPILPSDEGAPLTDMRANEASFKKRLDETMNITFENDVASEEASKLWKFLFDVMRFKDKDKESLEIKDAKLLEKVNTSVRNKLLRLFGADQNFYDLCTLTHCTYYQSVATVLKISLKYLKLTALLVMKLAEYEDNERVTKIKEIIGEESKKKVTHFEELKSKSVSEFDDFYFLSFNEKIDRLKEASKKVQTIESDELPMIDRLAKMLEMAK